MTNIKREGAKAPKAPQQAEKSATESQAAQMDAIFANDPGSAQPAQNINSPYGIEMRRAASMVEFWKPEKGDVIAGHYLGRTQRKIGRNCPHVILDYATGDYVFLPSWHGLNKLDELQDIGCDFVQVTFKGERDKGNDEKVMLVDLRIGKMPEEKRLKLGVDFDPADWNTSEDHQN